MEKAPISPDSPLGKALAERGLFYVGDRPGGFIEGWTARDVEAEESLRAVADQRDEAIHIAEARGVEKDRHRREKLAAEERVRVLTEALTTLLDGKAGQILGGYARATHPGRAYVELGHIYQEWWDEAQRDLNTARAALAVSSTENEEEQK